MKKTRTRNLAKLGPVELAGALQDDQLDQLAEAYRRWHLLGTDKVPDLWILFHGRRRHDLRRLETAGLVRLVNVQPLVKPRRWQFTVTSQGVMILLEFQRNGITPLHVTLPAHAVPGDGYHQTMRARLRLALRNYKMADLAAVDLRVPLGPGGNANVHIEHDFRKFVAEGLEQCHHNLFPLAAEGMRISRNGLYWLRRHFLATMQIILEDVSERRWEGTLPATKFEDYEGDQDPGSVTVVPAGWTEDSGEDPDEAGITFQWRYQRVDPPDDPDDHADRGVLLVALDWYDGSHVSHDDERYWLGLDALWTRHDRLVAWRVLREAEDLIEVLPRDQESDLDGDPLPGVLPNFEGAATHCPETGLPYAQCDCDLEECQIARGLKAFAADEQGDVAVAYRRWHEDEGPSVGIAIVDDCRFEDPLPDAGFNPEDWAGRWLARLLRTAAARVPRKTAERARVVRQVRLAGLKALDMCFWGGAAECGWIERHDEPDPAWTWEWHVWASEADADLEPLVERGAKMWRCRLCCREHATGDLVTVDADVVAAHLGRNPERLAKLVDCCRRIAGAVAPGRGALPVACPPRYASAAALVAAYDAGWLDGRRFPLRADTDAMGRYVRFWVYDPEDDFVVFERDAGTTLDELGWERYRGLLARFGLV